MNNLDSVSIFTQLFRSATTDLPMDRVMQLYCAERIAPAASDWGHLADRLVDFAVHANFAGALVLVALTALGVSICALYTVQLAIRALRDGRRKPVSRSKRAGRDG
jgi:hypothetical protein